MTSEDRNAMLDWADATGSVLIEDDYDSEFRFDVAPVPSMAGMRPDSPVAYLGTMSKVLDPGLRLAYVRVPAVLLPAVLEARAILGTSVPAPVQQAVSRFIRSGDLVRHIARMRRVYAERRKVLLSVLAGVPGIARVGGLEAGLHALVELDPALCAADVASFAAERGLRVADLDEFRCTPDLTRPGLLIAYGSAGPAGLRRAGEILTECIGLGNRGATARPGGMKSSRLVRAPDTRGSA
jgi:GntR family transcriptional regulator/MocR family aminotransferase